MALALLALDGGGGGGVPGTASEYTVSAGAEDGYAGLEKDDRPILRAWMAGKACCAPRLSAIMARCWEVTRRAGSGKSKRM